jgi:hypothetical protein
MHGRGREDLKYVRQQALPVKMFGGATYYFTIEKYNCRAFTTFESNIAVSIHVTP